MKPENKALLVVVLAVLVVTAVGGAAVYYLGGNAPSSTTLIPTGSFSLTPECPSCDSSSAFSYSNNATASYTVTGAWTASAPVQVIVGEVLGPNYGGCGFYPLNYPAGAPAAGCWPAFNASPEGSFSFAFHVCVSAQRLPTGSFLVIFRSTTEATVTVTQPFVVQASGFPQSSCPSSGL